MQMGRPSEDSAGKLAAVRGVFAAFDWEHDDRQYALEKIERIVTAGDTRQSDRPEDWKPTPVTVVSFGYGHGAPPEAHATFDVRHHFKDPHVNPGLRDLTAFDAPVADAVLGTAGIPALIDSVTAMARAFCSAPRPGPVTIAVGCVGGRHRSAVIAMEVARHLDLDGISVTVSHRDIDRPVIQRCARGAK